MASSVTHPFSLHGTLFEQLDDALVIVDDTGNLLDANPAACCVLGVERAAVAGQPLGALLAQVPEWAATPFSAEPGETAVRFLRLHPVPSDTNDAILTWDGAGRITAWNRGAAQIYGWTAAEATGRRVESLLNTESSPAHVAARAALAAADRWEGRLVETTRTGAQVIVDSRWSVLRDGDGKVRRVLAVSRNRTDCVRLEAELRAADEKFRKLFDAAGDGFALIDATGKLVDVNLSYCALLGRTHAELVGVHLSKVVEDTPPEFVAAIATQVARTGRATFERQYRHKDGSLRPVEVTVTPLPNGARLAVVRDISARKEAEAALAASQEMYRLLAENASDVVSLIDADGRVIYTSPSHMRRLGYTPEESLRLDIPAILQQIHPDDREAIGTAIRLGRAHKLPTTTYQYRIQTKQGGYVWLEDSIRREFDAQGNLVRSIINSRDITDRKTAEQALQASEERLRYALEAVHESIWDWNLATDEVFINDRWYELFGYAPEEVTSALAFWQRSLHPDDAAATLQAIGDYLQGRTPTYAHEHRVVTGSGAVRWHLSVGKVVTWGADGKPLRFVGADSDITDRKEAEQALRDSEARYRNLFETSPVAIAVAVGQQVAFVNPACVRLLGAQREADLVGRSFNIFGGPGAEARAEERSRRVAAGDVDVYPVEEIFRRLDGTLFDAEVTASQIVYAGQPAWQVMLTDISQRKQAAAQLRLQATALEAAANAIVITDRQGNMQWANRAFTTLTGYTVEEGRGRNLHKLLHSELQDGGFYAQMWASIAAGEVWQGEFVSRRKDGEFYTEEQTITPVVNAEGDVTHIVAIQQDISARKQHERELATVASVSAALRAALTRAEMIPLILHQLLSLLRIEGATLVTIDPAQGELHIELGMGVWEDRTGQRMPTGAGIAGEILQTGAPYLNNDINTDMRRYRADAFAPCRAVAGAPLLVRRQVTGLIWIGSNQPLTDHDLRLLTSIADIAANALHRALLHDQLQAQAQRLVQVMETAPQGILLLTSRGHIILANPVAQRLLDVLTSVPPGAFITHLGERPLRDLLTAPQPGLRHEVQVGSQTFEITARPIPDIDQWVLLVDDVTQARQLQHQLQQQERLAAVGQLAAGIAHDFNNIMAIIILYAEMIGQNADLPDRDRERLHTVTGQARRASELIRQILDFSRQSVLARQTLDLLPVVKEQVKLLERTLPESIVTHFEHDGGDFTVNADPTRLQQLIMNLAINARDAMPDGGVLTLTLTHLTVGEDAPTVPSLRPGAWLKLTVADTGTGIPREVLPHIFDPFFTTKAPGKGTGLGLAQVHGIVAQHEGRIDVASNLHTGTTFTVYLPAAPAVHSSPPAQVAAAGGQGELILVVEDNAALRDALVEMVEVMDYTVLAAANGQEALELMQRQAPNVAVVLSDVVMPVMGGIQLFQALRTHGYTMPLIFMTGHPREREMDKLQTLGAETWLMKPVQPNQLAQALHQAARRAHP